MGMMKVAKEKCNDGSDECFTGGLDDGLEDELRDGISECCTVLMDLMWG